MSFYAVRKGLQPGIYNTWDECKAQVHRFTGAQYKKFHTHDEASAFLEAGPGGQPPRSAASTTSTRAAPYPSIASAATSLDRDTGRRKMGAAKTFRTPTDGSRGSTIYSPPAETVARDKSSSLVNASSSSWSPELQGMRCATARARQELAALKKMVTSHNSNRIDTPATATIENNNSPKPDPLAEDDSLWEDDAALLEAAELCDPTPCQVPATTNSEDFVVDSSGYLHVWTDGACVSNGRKGARAGLGVWFNRAHRLNVSEPVDGTATNNNAEIQAAWMALEVAAAAGYSRVSLHTDSKFVINCATQWVHRWRRNGWKLNSGGDVKNRKQLEALIRAMQGVDVKWNYVKGHSGVEGNEGADRLAVAGAKRYQSL